MGKEDTFKEEAAAAFRELLGSSVMVNMNKLEFIRFFGPGAPIRGFEVSVWSTRAESALPILTRPVLTLNIRAVCNRGKRLNMLLTHEGYLSALQRDIQSGDSPFDKRYNITADNEQLAQSIVADPEVRRLVVATDDVSRFERLEIICKDDPRSGGSTLVEVEFRPEPLKSENLRSSIELINYVSKLLV